MDNGNDLDPREARANVLYWDSDTSVNDIAEQLDLSKGTLYGMVRPRTAGIDCPECGGEMEYPNRTAREKGFVTCSVCGYEEEEALILEAAAQNLEDRGTRAARQMVAPDAATLATVLLSAAAGILLVRWLRR
jgi:predicted RNA-binding Zn-ribbon protein involved in translation (DUF1610 family)